MTRAMLFVCLSVLLALVAWGPVHAQDASEEATPAPPPIQIIAPEAGCVANVGEKLQVMLLVQADLDISTIAVTCDGKGLGMLNEAPYVVEWDTSGLSPGDHVLRAFAYLTSGEKLGSAPLVVVLRDGDSAAPEATPEDEVAEQADSPPATAEQADSSPAVAEPGRPQRLTDNDAQDTYPSWSPDGKKISFTSDRDGNSEIYVMNPDGSEQTNLTKDDRYVDAFSTWSPGGKYIAYTHQGRGWPRRIRIMNADGTGQHYPKEQCIIIPGLRKPVEGEYPSWCPDGNKIAFVGTKGITTPRLFGPDSIILVPKIEVYSFSSKSVAYGPDAGAVDYDKAFLPSWLPNGAELLFASGKRGSAVSQIYRAPFTERGIRMAVTNGGGLKERPSWSQDAKNVVFAARVNNNWDIYVLKYGEKTEVVRLTDHPASDRNPCWSPDGKKIAFESRRDGDNEIYVINLDPSSGGRIGLPPVEDLDGNAVHLPLDGKVTVLLYCPSWASYYREDAEFLESETSLYPDVRGCFVFAASDREEVAKEVREKGYRLAFLLDKMGELGKALNCTWQRRLYVVAGDGKMLFAEDPADEADTVIRDAKAAVAKALDAKAEEQEASTGQ